MSTTLLENTERIIDGRSLFVSERPIDFEQFLDISCDANDIELVAEVVFINPQKKQWTVLRKRNGDYMVEILAVGEYVSEVVPGFHLNIEWLLNNEMPNEMDVLNGLLST